MRKAQAAMEFLMTYGWAILVVLAAIGALAYFGVLSPDRFLPSKCTVAPGFGCTEAAATATMASFRLKNNIGKDLESYEIRLEAGDVAAAGGTTCGDADPDYTITGAPAWLAVESGAAFVRTGYDLRHIRFGATNLWKNSDEATINLGGAGVGCAYSGKVNIDFTIFYTQSGGTLENQAGGSMQLQVQT